MAVMSKRGRTIDTPNQHIQKNFHTKAKDNDDDLHTQKVHTHVARKNSYLVQSSTHTLHIISVMNITEQRATSTHLEERRAKSDARIVMSK